VRHIPTAVLLEHLNIVLPIILESLSSNQSVVRKSMIETIIILIDEAAKVISDHIQSVILKLIELTSDKDNMEVRIKSLECLFAITSLPYHILFPYKTKVINALAKTLDDKKRSVRVVAVKCRNAWYILKSKS